MLLKQKVLLWDNKWGSTLLELIQAAKASSHTSLAPPNNPPHSPTTIAFPVSFGTKPKWVCHICHVSNKLKVEENERKQEKTRTRGKQEETRGKWEETRGKWEETRGKWEENEKKTRRKREENVENTKQE
jgi:hypothetical protein